MTQSRKTKPRQRKAERNELSEDLLTFLFAQQMDLAADYVKRGRSHRDVADADLIEAWRLAYRAYARDPGLGPRAALGDLQAEFDIRGLAIPWAAVREDLDRLTTLVEQVEADLEADPERMRALDQSLRADLADFKAWRDRPRN